MGRSSCATADKALCLTKQLEYKMLHKDERCTGWAKAPIQRKLAILGRPHSVRHAMHDLGNMSKSKASVAKCISKALKVPESKAKKWLFDVVMCCYSYMLFYVVICCLNCTWLYVVVFH